MMIISLFFYLIRIKCFPICWPTSKLINVHNKSKLDQRRHQESKVSSELTLSSTKFYICCSSCILCCQSICGIWTRLYRLQETEPQHNLFPMTLLHRPGHHTQEGHQSLPETQKNTNTHFKISFEGKLLRQIGSTKNLDPLIRQ